MAACFSAQTGTLAFAIINLVLVTGSNVSLIGLLMYYGFKAFYFYTPSTSLETTMTLIYKMAAVLVVLFLMLVNLLFSSFLMNGIRKKKPEHLKVYYIFGVGKVVLSLFILLIVFVASAGMPPYSYVYYIVLALHFLYAIILHMIRYTYLQLETINKQFKHVPLNEKC